MFFYDEIHNELAKLEGDEDHRIIIGGDFNVILDPYFRWIGRETKIKRIF